MFHNANHPHWKHITTWTTITLLSLATIILFMALSFSFSSAALQHRGKSVDGHRYAQCVPGDECPGFEDTWGNG